MYHATKNYKSYQVRHARSARILRPQNAIYKTLCVPSQCTTYTWQADDTYDSVVGGLENVTLSYFFSWNSNIISLCLNDTFFIGVGSLPQVSISTTLASLLSCTMKSPETTDLLKNHTAGGADLSTDTVVTVATIPAVVLTNAIDNNNYNCSQCYTVSNYYSFPLLEAGIFDGLLGSRWRCLR